MAQFQSYNSLLVSKDDIENIVVGEAIIGYHFKAQYPSYRGTFLSCIEQLEVYIDGERICDDDIYFAINGKEFLLSQLPEHYAEYWYILDKADIRIIKMGGTKEKSHEVTVKMQHRIPYTGYFGGYMVLESSDTKRLQVKGAC